MSLKLIFFSYFLFLARLTNAEDTNITVKGYCNGLPDLSVVEIKSYYPFRTFQSYVKIHKRTVVENERFVLNISSSTTELYLLSISVPNKKDTSIFVFIQPGILEIHLEYYKMEFKFSLKKNQAAIDYSKFEELNSSFVANAKVESKYKLVAENFPFDYIQVDRDSSIMVFEKQKVQIGLYWILSYPNSIINTYVIKEYLMKKISDGELSNFYNSSTNDSKSNSYGLELNYYLTYLTLGKKPPDFALHDTSGNLKTLKDFEGSFVLIDFWASWCGPCRVLNPRIKSIYDKYKAFNFQIVSISLDRDKYEWEKAILTDQMSWIHLSDLKYWSSSAALLYGIKSIPAFFLLNSKGEIIFKSDDINSVEYFIEIQFMTN